MISQLAKHVREVLEQALPNTLIKDKEYISYKGQRLFFDFYLPSYELYVEVQGVQHTRFSKHFHNDASVFRAQKKRDRLKSEWCELNDKVLLCIQYDEVPITVDEILERIKEAQHG